MNVPNDDIDLIDLIDAITHDNENRSAWSGLHAFLLPIVQRVVQSTQWGDAVGREEVVQEAMTRIFTAPTLKTLRSKGSLIAFVKVVAINEVRRAIKARKRTKHLSSLDQIAPEKLGRRSDIQESAEHQDLIERSLSVLSDLDRRILRGVLDGFSATDIAKDLGLSTVNVGVRLHRLRIVLRTRLLAHYLKD